MKVRRWIVFLLFIGLLSSCAIAPKYNPDGSPVWTTQVPKSTRKTYYAVASAKQSTPQLSLLRAESSAKDAIGRWATTSVEAALLNYVGESGLAGQEQAALEALQHLSIQRVKIELRGVRVEEQYLSPDGTLWVLVSYPIQNLEEAYRLKAEELERAYQIDLRAAGGMGEYLDHIFAEK